MSTKSLLGRMTASINLAPQPIARRLLTGLVGHKVPFVGHAGVRIETLRDRVCICSIRNRRKAQNHIRGVHACATALVAESATGFIVGMHLPEDKIPLLKSMQMDYIRRAKGSIRATATLTDEHIMAMHTHDQGEINVPVEIRDEAGDIPVRASLTWAWVSKRRNAHE